MTKEVEFDLKVDKELVKMGLLRKAEKRETAAQYKLLTDAMYDLDGVKIAEEKCEEILDELNPIQYAKLFGDYIKLLYDIPLS